MTKTEQSQIIVQKIMGKLQNKDTPQKIIEKKFSEWFLALAKTAQEQAEQLQQPQSLEESVKGAGAGASAGGGGGGGGGGGAPPAE